MREIGHLLKFYLKVARFESLPEQRPSLLIFSCFSLVRTYLLAESSFNEATWYLLHFLRNEVRHGTQSELSVVSWGEIRSPKIMSVPK